MLFTQRSPIGLLAAIASLTQVHASPIAEAGSDLVPIQSEVLAIDGLSNATITWYGEDSSFLTKRSPSLAARGCGSNDVFCATNHHASNTLCRTLVNTFNGATYGIPPAPRAVCLSGSDGQCCVSWSAVVQNLGASELFSAAQKTYNQCSNYITSGVSGYTTNTQLNGVCLHQCLSNQPGGC